MKTDLGTEFTIERQVVGLSPSTVILRVKSERVAHAVRAYFKMGRTEYKGEGFCLTPEECIELGTMLIRAAGPVNDAGGQTPRD
jgi:hypothetical protein